MIDGVSCSSLADFMDLLNVIVILWETLPLELSFFQNNYLLFIKEIICFGFQYIYISVYLSIVFHHLLICSC